MAENLKIKKLDTNKKWKPRENNWWLFFSEMTVVRHCSVAAPLAGFWVGYDATSYG